MVDEPNREENMPAQRLSRREALARLGLAAGATYAAPTLIGLNEAAADDGSDGGPPWAGNGKGKSKNKSSKGKGD